MPLKPNNPAARLYNALESLRNQNHGTVLADAWRSVLLVHEPTNLDLVFFRRYGKLLSLPERAHDAIKRIAAINFRPYLRWLPSAQEAFRSVALNHNVGLFLQKFNDQAFESLQVAADLLSSRHPEATVRDPAALAKICQDAIVLRRDVEADTIDADLKRYLLDLLDDIVSAINDYGLEGFEVLERSVERTLGSLALRPSAATKSGEGAVGKRFWTIFYHVFIAIAAPNGALQLPHNFQQFLIDSGIAVGQRGVADAARTRPPEVIESMPDRAQASPAPQSPGKNAPTNGSTQTSEPPPHSR